MNTNFLRIFTKEKEAEKFANLVFGKIIVRYSYDTFYGLIKEFVVEY